MGFQVLHVAWNGLSLSLSLSVCELNVCWFARASLFCQMHKTLLCDVTSCFPLNRVKVRCKKAEFAVSCKVLKILSSLRVSNKRMKEHPSVYTLKVQSDLPSRWALPHQIHTTRIIVFHVSFLLLQFCVLFLYGCETWSLTLRVFEDRVLRNIFGALKERGNRRMEKTIQRGDLWSEFLRKILFSW
jgi:hypothetical protein